MPTLVSGLGLFGSRQADTRSLSLTLAGTVRCRDGVDPYNQGCASYVAYGVNCDGTTWLISRGYVTQNWKVSREMDLEDDEPPPLEDMSEALSAARGDRYFIL